MREVREAVEYYAVSRLQSSYKLRNIKFYVSGSNVAGEGEVKIIE